MEDKMNNQVRLIEYLIILLYDTNYIGGEKFQMSTAKWKTIQLLMEDLGYSELFEWLLVDVADDIGIDFDEEN